LSNANLNNGSGVATMLSRLKSTHAFKQEFSSELKQTILTSNLLITLNYGAFGLHLGLEELKDRTIKLSTMSRIL
jgi:hypothetical protein